ncbi:MAG TPA: HlyD family secretion protein [Hellea balneolensis]|uniref:HlyD family secretion protein n=1 Tax=Hellea balneolensis TaxID=287478 RepID=A0A7C5M1M2_9PROT|nr:HlyD family secretion protein [Hellea balneolensis]
MKTALTLCIALFLIGCKDAPPEPAHVGYIEADWVYISAPEPGWITARPIVEGQELYEGDVVFELDKELQETALTQAEGQVEKADAQAKNLKTGARPAEIRALQAKLAEAKAQLAQAKSDRDRILKLVAQGVVPRTQGEKVTTAYTSAKARVKAAEEAIRIAKLGGRKALKQAATAAEKSALAARTRAQINLQRRTVLARTSGRIEEIFRHQGEFVTTGTPIVSILPKDGLKARFFVSQAELPHIKIGEEIQITADGQTTPTTAKISYISNQAEYTPPVIYSVGSRDKLVFLVEATLEPGTNLHPGLPIDVSLP